MLHDRLPSFLIFFLLLVHLLPAGIQAQDQAQDAPPDRTPETAVPDHVDVPPAATDSQIQDRLMGILNATGWFTDPEVEVNEGVVFLRGTTDSDNHKRWAGDLARNTQDVAAVVNQMQVTEPDIWDYEPAFIGIQDLWYSILRSIPFFIFGIVVLIIFWGISTLVAKITRVYIRRRDFSPLLQDIAARTVAVVVFLLGIYIVFHIADLTQVALTVLGGTGLLGIILGIAFRDITENFLASIFLSIQNPFRAGDLVHIDGTTGFIQRLTIRATLMMTLDGNHIQIPNSTVYKSSILNYTSNPNQRTRFTIGIGYEDSITAAQEIGSEVLKEHPAVLQEPEPWILVDELAASTINLQYFFWVDGTTHNILKVKSSVLRQIKTAYLKEGISMPDELRERIFPDGVSVHVASDEDFDVDEPTDEKPIHYSADDAKVMTEAEGDLKSDDDEILEQARRARSPEEGDDLLKSK